jgi:hypothetical protein
MLTIAFLTLQPREALLKYAEMATNDPQWTAGKQDPPFFLFTDEAFARAGVEIFCFYLCLFVMNALTWRLFPKPYSLESEPAHACVRPCT